MPALAPLVKRARALVFDFDGTLVDSNAIKHRAFERCFADAPAARREAIAAYCRGSHHTPRWEKFRHVYEQILKRPYTFELQEKLLRRFDIETTRPIARAPEIPGASRFLAQAARTHVTALLSSTPQEALLDILDRRGWRGHFQTVQGAPVNKTKWLARWRATQGYGGDEVVFFGDTAEDARAAQRAGCVFVGVANQDLRDEAVQVLEDFTGMVNGR